MSDFETPMMVQYKEIKDAYPDCLLFFRLGDFYELFLDDAKVGANVLGITLTSRSRGKDGRIPMAGVPYHAVNSYLSKLVKAGHKVAICEQVGDTKGPDLVKREVVRVVTPGTLIDQNSLDKSKNNYVAALCIANNTMGLSFADVSTGHFHSFEETTNEIQNVLLDHFSKYTPAEILLNDATYNDSKTLKLLTELGISIYNYASWSNYSSKPEKHLLTHFNLTTLASFGMGNTPLATETASVLLGYLKETQKDKVSHINKINFSPASDYVELGRSTIFNLELFSTIREGEKYGSLIGVLDETLTPMGARLLRKWIARPLTNISSISARQNSVSEFLENRQLRNNLLGVLKEINDIERILSKISVGLGNARDLVNLKDSLIAVLEVKQVLNLAKSSLNMKLKGSIDSNLQKLVDKIHITIVDEPPIELKQGNLIKPGVSSKLDDLKRGIKTSQEWISSLEEKEKERTGISTLKVGYNKIFGYYIEISKSNLHLVPESYVRKQTLVSAERFITQRLKEEEEQVLAAEDKINDLEYEIFSSVVDNVLNALPAIQVAAEAVAELDCLVNFAVLAKNYNYCKPNISTSGNIKIINGRHPVVERLLREVPFVPNDVNLNHEDHQLILITGPNMAGKSVYIRQVGLITLMAQMGSFVPADSAEISVVDKIFVRSGASDFITSGLSTFMVEMVETAHILNNSTKNSLILLDEIGRGTTTYDGVSIAWAVAEYLVKNQQPFAKTMFATHYHELQDLAKESSLVKNYQVLAKEESGKPIFLHKVAPGGASHSYGVAVAQLAGIPDVVTTRALEILSTLQGKSFEDWLHEDSIATDNVSNELTAKLSSIDVNTLTPIEALLKLKELKEKLQDQAV
ncbi:MAG: DNA mismatch repair protein MutS [Patescibacteria group bacterium]